MVVIKKYSYIAFCAILCAVLISCKKKSSLKISPSTITTSSPEENITIFVHGTHFTKLLNNLLKLPPKLAKIKSLNSLWYASVLKEMVKNHPQYFFESSFYTFGWTGELSPKAREEAAQILYNSIKELVNKHPVKPKITLITHSHGGNVALNLAKVKDANDNDFSIDKLVLLACPVQEVTKNHITNQIFKKVYHIYSQADMIQILDPQVIQKENNNNSNCPWLSNRRFNACPNLKQAKIKINDRSILHIEFILNNFLSILPNLLEEMNKIEESTEQLIKISSNPVSFKIINLQNYKGKIKKAINCQ